MPQTQVMKKYFLERYKRLEKIIMDIENKWNKLKESILGTINNHKWKLEGNKLVKHWYKRKSEGRLGKNIKEPKKK